MTELVLKHAICRNPISLDEIDLLCRKTEQAYSITSALVGRDTAYLTGEELQSCLTVIHDLLKQTHETQEHFFNGLEYVDGRTVKLMLERQE